MAKKGGSTKLKRLAAPITYKIPRKTGKWVVKASPGPHPSWRSIPIAILIRDVLKIARTLREVKYMLRKEYIYVDGRPIKDYRFPIGLMDVVEIIPTNEAYRLLPTKRYLIHPYPIKEEADRKIKPLRIKNKVMVKGGKIQITTHDGRNFLLDKENTYSGLKPGDTLVYVLDTKEIKDFIRLEDGILALVTGGSKIGTIGKVVEIRKPDPLKPKLVKLSTEEFGEFETIFDYVFPIGKESPTISLY